MAVAFKNRTFWNYWGVLGLWECRQATKQTLNWLLYGTGSEQRVEVCRHLTNTDILQHAVKCSFNRWNIGVVGVNSAWAWTLAHVLTCFVLSVQVGTMRCADPHLRIPTKRLKDYTFRIIANSELTEVPNAWQQNNNKVLSLCNFVVNRRWLQTEGATREFGASLCGNISYCFRCLRNSLVTACFVMENKCVASTERESCVVTVCNSRNFLTSSFKTDLLNSEVKGSWDRNFTLCLKFLDRIPRILPMMKATEGWQGDYFADSRTSG
jgi:hypothetical protein